LAETKMFGYSGPMWDLSYLANLVAPVGSATESPLALSGPLPAAVSRGRNCYFFNHVVCHQHWLCC
jgi:hypothetical protein